MILDSGHSKQHVLGELDAYSDLVSVGSYLVAADGIMRDGVGAPRTQPEWSYDNPRAAADDFLASHPAFVREEPPWGFNESVGLCQSITYWRGGWLRRVPVSLDPALLAGPESSCDRAHSGFKGAWLCLWLRRLGAQVAGFALEPESEPNLFGASEVSRPRVSSEIGDVRDLASFKEAADAAGPQVLLSHLAAQALVRDGYARPVETFSTNVIGTVHALEIARLSADLGVDGRRDERQVLS